MRSRNWFSKQEPGTINTRRTGRIEEGDQSSSGSPGTSVRARKVVDRGGDWHDDDCQGLSPKLTSASKWVVSKQGLFIVGQETKSSPNREYTFARQESLSAIKSWGDRSGTANLYLITLCLDQTPNESGSQFIIALVHRTFSHHHHPEPG